MMKLREGITKTALTASSGAMWLRHARPNLPMRNNNVRLGILGSRFKSSSSNASVALQLDYYMSPQFGGVAAAVVNGLYDGMDVKFLPTCPVGLEPARVRQYQTDNPTVDAVVGSVEQNILIPTLRQQPELRVQAVAAMFRRSPLCIASLAGSETADGVTAQTIGAHEDTVELLRRIFPNDTVVASPRASKTTDLTNGALTAIQAYTTTEVPTLRALVGEDPVVTPLEGQGGAKLGYGQVLFASEESVEVGSDRRAVTQAFLEATFRGWEQVIANPSEGLAMVQEAQRMLGLDDENNDHWHPSTQQEMLERCNDLVKETFEGDRLGVIDDGRWDSATRWLLDDPSMKSGFGLDGTGLWKPPANLLSGNELASNILETARLSAERFAVAHNRRPSVVVITVGDLDRYTDAERRVQLYSHSEQSWFSKTKTGQGNGFDVEEINLPSTTSTAELLGTIDSVKDKVDGVQLMWPLPDHIDTSTVYNAIPVDKDVDGIHYVGQREIGNADAFPPVTPAAVMELLKNHGIELGNKRALVIGRSPIVGSPVAHMLREEGAVVTVAHSGVSRDQLQNLVGEAEVIVTCAGSPGLIPAEWVKNKDAVVVNVGTTFVDDGLVADFEGDLSLYAAKHSHVPGGIGPLSVPILFRNVATAAWKN